MSVRCEPIHPGAGAPGSARARLPSHCVRPAARPPEVAEIQRLLRRAALHSVCEEARCPNRALCWSQRHVTFLLLGDLCTRSCGFCSVASGRPLAGPDPREAESVARAAEELALAHVVLTSVNRDDLADGGASHFAACIRAIHRRCPEASVEVLTPDFRGDVAAVATVCAAGPDVYNHNVETVPRLYRRVRPGARLERSLRVLAEARRRLPRAVVKSGFMVGLGEELLEVEALLMSLRTAGVDSVTIGQYLRPTRRHLPVSRYWEPREFDALAARARALGFEDVASGPLVRSSFNAGQTLTAIRARRGAGGPRSRSAPSGDPQ